MGYLIGTDEAGYGPNLGPLVISATTWEVPDGVENHDLHEHLAAVVCRKPAGKAAGRQSLAPPAGRSSHNRTAQLSPVAMADSKALYSPGKGLHNLEAGLYAALAAVGLAPRSWRELWNALAPAAVERMRSIPWLADYYEPTPIDCDGERCAAMGEALRKGLDDARVKLIAIRSRVVFEEEFNTLVDRHGSKGTPLSLNTLALAGESIASLPPGPVSVVCDKHGGRNRYAALLANQFPHALIEIHGEGRPASRYRFGPQDRRVEFCFRMKAESCLPAALASMASKYLRETAMRAFNEFWRRRLPDLKPTAGYPLDAKRFRADIAAEQRRLHIDDRLLWRAV